MLETPATKPFCSLCKDFHYLKRRADGKTLVCPQCSCPRCQRLLNTHPDLGGCICECQENQKRPAPRNGS